jgi:metal-responsive CopG/Arc/MetJ family transcriptional regulator
VAGVKAAPEIKRILVSIDANLLARVDSHTRQRSAYIAHALRRALEAEGVK